MDDTWLMALKYVSWLLTVGTAFAGSWFFEYTTTDKETGRRKLTAWGRFGVIFAGLALAFSLALTVWTDRDAASKKRLAAEQAANDRVNANADRAKASEYQQRLEGALADLKTLVAAIDKAPLSREGKEAIQKTVTSLVGLEDYRKYYPDLYARLTKVGSWEEGRQVIAEGVYRSVMSRIADRPECSAVPRPDPLLTKGFPGGHFLIGGSAAITYLITSAHTQFEFTVPGTPNSLGGGGYSFVFDDGSESDMLQCSHRKTGSSCADLTSDPRAAAVYSDLQRKFVAAVKTVNKRYDVPGATAHTIRTTFACIAP